jgi:hypothetical protein
VLGVAGYDSNQSGENDGTRQVEAVGSRTVARGSWRDGLGAKAGRAGDGRNVVAFCTISMLNMSALISLRRLPTVLWLVQ